MRLLSELFGNPRHIVSDKGAALTSHDSKENCAEENVEQNEIIKVIPRGNGQVDSGHVDKALC